MISSLFYKLGASLAGRLPVEFSEHVTTALSRSQYYMRDRSRRNVLRNTSLAMAGAADEEVRRTARDVFDNFGRSIYSFLRLPYISPVELRAGCDYSGIDAVTADLRLRGGFVFAGPHVGPWEMAGACLNALGLKIHTVAFDHPSPRVTKFFDQRRSMAGIVCHPVGNSFPVLCEVLERGECVALLIDRTYGKTRRSFTMFGRSVGLPSGHAALAVRCRVPILTTACVFRDDGGLKFVFRGPHYPNLERGEEAAFEDLHRRCRADMEEFIAAFPGQWFHFTEFGEDQS